MKNIYRVFFAAAAMVGVTTSASALTYSPFDTSPEFLVTPTKPAPNDNEIVIGTGITNGSFTKTTNNGVEIGQRAKLRFDANGDPQNQTNFDQVDTYTFNQNDGAATAGLSIWNIETSVFLASLTLNEIWLEYEFADPLGNKLNIDNSYFNLVGGNAVLTGLSFAQSSENPGFSSFAAADIDPFAVGLFTSTLSIHACDNGIGANCEKGSQLATNQIQINQIPLPAGAPLLVAGIGILMLLRRRKYRTTA